MNAIIVGLALIASASTFAAYDGNIILKYLNVSQYSGTNNDGICYVSVNRDIDSEGMTSITISKDPESTDLIARFNELTSYNLVSEEGVPDWLKLIIENSSNDVLVANQKSTLEIAAISGSGPGPEVWIENEVMSPFGWKIEESGFCLIDNFEKSDLRLIRKDE
jgi:hypothetical protein